MASLTVRPGSRVRLKGQDSHVPDFFVVRCERDRCWIRQQDWGPETLLHVRFTQLLVPDHPGVSLGSLPPVAIDPLTAPVDNVIYMDAYRHRQAR
jgi:hypothetical protein